MNFFASVLQWFNDLDIGWKIGIGIALFVVACIITVATILYTCVNAKIEAIDVEQLAAPETTYNFEVADFHTYYVSESKVLVHNKCAFAEFYDNPETLIGKSADEVGEALGEGWTRTAYGSRGDGWRFMNKHGAKLIYHPAGGKHKTVYYILQQSQNLYN